MSLKIFHIIFVILAVLTSGSVAWLFFGFYGKSQLQSHLLSGILFSALTVALLVYGVWFLQKLKKNRLF
jgi:high-affinity Fe2+/Pb2+ permease